MSATGGPSLSVIVRPAELTDADALAALERDARAAAADLRGGPALLAELLPVGAWCGAIDDPGRPVWVADLEGSVVGFLQAEVVPPLIVVRQVWVHPEARELGFGEELLGAAIEHGRALGCAAIEANALPGDRLTKNLYERAGITARKIVLRAALSDPSTAADASR